MKLLVLILSLSAIIGIAEGRNICKNQKHERFVNAFESGDSDKKSYAFYIGALSIGAEYGSYVKIIYDEHLEDYKIKDDFMRDPAFVDDDDYLLWLEKVKDIYNDLKPKIDELIVNANKDFRDYLFDNGMCKKVEF